MSSSLQATRRLSRPLLAFLFGMWLVCELDGMGIAADQVVRSAVFVSGTEGYNTFRIPAAIVTRKGTLLAFCEGRKTSRSDHGDLDLVLRRSFDHGRSWDKMRIIHEEGGDKKITIGNPCPVIDQTTGRVWLPFCRNNDQVLITYSDDDGQTWAQPKDITASVKAPGWTWYATGPGVGIQMSQGRYKGRLVIPCDHGLPMDGKRVMYSHAFYSDDHGQTWKLGGTVERHTDECQVVELRDGTLMMNMRNYWGRHGNQQQHDKMRASAVSRDGGLTWGPLRFEKSLVEPICQASFLRYATRSGNADGGLLFANPASPSARRRLTVRISSDEGRTWPAGRLLHAGPAAYCCLTVLPDGSIGCLYEGGQKTAYEKILFVRFTRSWIQAGDPAGNSGR